MEIQICRSLFKAGIKEAWKGVETNAARLGVVNVCELVTYDVVKETILDYRLMKDNPFCHFTSAFLSGILSFKNLAASPQKKFRILKLSFSVLCRNPEKLNYLITLKSYIFLQTVCFFQALLDTFLIT